MKPTIEKRIIVALDLTHQSGREHLDGFYQHSDRKGCWEVRLVPSTEESYAPIAKGIVERGVDGAVVKGECARSVADAIFSAGIPVVAIDRPHHSTPYKADAYVTNDNDNIGREAAGYFDELGRFASYGFVPDPNNCGWSQIRGKAFLSAMSERHRDAIVEKLDWPVSERLAALPKPVAIFAAFDQCAATVLEICRELRLKIPKDVAVLGVDDDAIICEHTHPKLTSIRPDHVGQGFAAARELDRLLSGKARRRNDIVCRHIGITERDSTAVISPGVRIVREVNTYLDGHALKPIRVADIVAHVGVSSRLANLRYSEATGRSIQEELITRRLAEAKRLLEKTSWPMTRIATRCGFKSSIVLAHLFSSHFEMSMSDWRNTHGEI
ncbi:MAG: substrate-binding domain-containing protein [Kiritimatiellae bacterium]|nr:substrate-binding domain-containing protein [Kiritimatiellia bacterium]